MGLSEADLFALDENAELSSAKTNSIVTTAPQKPYLSETIDYDVDIAPHQFIKIYSGVGSGKNTFVNHLVKGDLFLHHDGTPVDPQYVWLISPRKAKILETLNLKDVKYDPQIGMFDSFENDWMACNDEDYEAFFADPVVQLADAAGDLYTIRQRSCVTTNAKVEYDLRKWYSAFDPRLQPWNRFDMIIVDEVHSLFSDATYQSASFYVRRLIEEILQRSKTCKVIVMTGAPHILQSSALLAKAHLIDRMKSCVNVMPKTLSFITRKEAAAKQRQMLASDKKFIAFYNQVDDLMEFEENLEDISRAKVCMAFSKNEYVQQMKRDKDPRLTKMIATQEYLAEYERLPEDVVAFLSTSKNKEGINIKNKDIHAMFVEAHAELDVIQMAGRLREPVDRLYVVVDSKDHRDNEDPLEYETARKSKLQAAINDEHHQICSTCGYLPNDPDAFWQAPAYSFKEIKAYIDHEHKKYPYLRYDYFTDCFQLYYERKVGKAYYARQRGIFEKARQTRVGLMQLAR